MMKDEQKSGITAYNYYLADLIREIEAAGCCAVRPLRKPKTWVGTRSNRTITLDEMLEPYPAPPPPYPPIFNALPADTLKNIERAVQIYRTDIRPLPMNKIQAKISDIYAMAWEVAGRFAEERCRKNVEKRLKAEMLECSGTANHLDYFALALMHLGMLRRDIEDTALVSKHSHEIENSLNRGFSERREENIHDSHTARHKQISGLGGQKTFEVSYNPAKQYALKRYAELSAGTEKTGKKLNKKKIAEHIHSELKTMPSLACPDFRVLYERWLPKKLKRKTHATG